MLLPIFFLSCNIVSLLLLLVLTGTQACVRQLHQIVGESFCCRDQSDGIWNESQTTVLQLDSGTENGTGVSSSELNSLTTSYVGSTQLLTPSSRRRHMLQLQHQQRSSMDTEILEEELLSERNVRIPCNLLLRLVYMR